MFQMKCDSLICGLAMLEQYNELPDVDNRYVRQHARQGDVHEQW